MPKKGESLNKITHILHRIKVFENWWTIVFPFTRLGKRKDRTMKLRTGSKIYLRDIFRSDFYVTMEIFDRDDYGVSQITLPSHAVILDVGANIGAFTLYAASLFPDAKIFSFEPELNNFETLKKNVALNNLRTVTALNEAVSSCDGSATLTFDRQDNASHSLEASSRDVGTQEIKTVTLQTIMERYGLRKIDLLKLDIEGTEYEVLMGDRSALERIDRIFLEVHEHPKYKSTQILEFLSDKGFEVVVSPARSNVFRVTRKGVKA